MQLYSKTIFGVLFVTLLLASASAPALAPGYLRCGAVLGNDLNVPVAARSAVASADSPQNDQRIQVMQADIASLRAATAKNQKGLQALSAALEGVHSRNYLLSLVYVLGALLTVCLAALVYVVVRLRNRGLTGSADLQSQPVGLDSDAMRSAVAMVAPVSAGPEALPAREALAVRAPQAPFSLGNDGAMKTINTTETRDVRQQAEFFMALGQHEEAVRLLESGIRDTADSNPLILLDLLKVFHTLGRREEFERYREVFNLQFTGRVPGYAAFLSEGNGLEAYEEICQQIIVLWPTEYTVDFIEQCLVRTQEDDPEQGIDLEAFKELLLLYGVLRRLEQSEDSGSVPLSTATGLLNAEVRERAQPVAVVVAPSPALGRESSYASVDLELDLHWDLDLDLSSEQASAGRKSAQDDFDLPGHVKPPPGAEPTP